MTPKTSGCALEALADRIEKLKGPDREVDARIWLLVGEEMGEEWKPKGRGAIKPSSIIMGRWMGSALEKYPEDAGGVANSWRVPWFTESLDAAMTLLSNGIGDEPFSFKVERFYLGSGIEKCRSSVWDGLGRVSSLDTASEAATPALALCAAALRARARQATSAAIGGGE